MATESLARSPDAQSASCTSCLQCLTHDILTSLMPGQREQPIHQIPINQRLVHHLGPSVAALDHHGVALVDFLVPRSVCDLLELIEILPTPVNSLIVLISAGGHSLVSTI